MVKNTDNAIKKEYETIYSQNTEWAQLNKTKILILGATGMIGSAIGDFCIYLITEKKIDIELWLSGRNEDRLRERFAYCPKSNFLHFFEHDVVNPFDIEEKFDLIIHTASEATPIAYATRPVEVMLANFSGMNNVLDYIKDTSKTKVIFVSSGEVYGELPQAQRGFDEKTAGYINYEDIRSCYPVSKRAAEILCKAYADEYNVEIKIVRPCHVYGPSMTQGDSRAASQFIKDVCRNKNIHMKSDGTQKRSMCYVYDLVSAIFFIHFKGKNGEAYNIADSRTVCSIKEFAEMVAQKGGTEVVMELASAREQKGFNRVQNAILLSDKIEALGWQALTPIDEGVEKTLKLYEE